MSTSLPRPVLLFLVTMLLVGNGTVFVHAFGTPEQHRLSISFLDVGQGDAILVEGPSGIQMLIDGGKDRSVLRELPRVMGPLDRSIDVVVATHPDADHIGGLADVLGRYTVANLIESGREGESGVFAGFVDARDRENAPVVEARSSMRIHLGGGAYADILHPEDNVTKLRDTNDASVSMRIVYGKTEFMLTGDAPAWVEERLVTERGSGLRSDLLKAGHHGSKTSTSAAFLAAVDPSIVVISAGKDNSYGHPHEEVLERIVDSGASYVSTAEEGTITYTSDGRTIGRQ